MPLLPLKQGRANRDTARNRAVKQQQSDAKQALFTCAMIVLELTRKMSERLRKSF